MAEVERGPIIHRRCGQVAAIVEKAFYDVAVLAAFAVKLAARVRMME
jgi:hypothetical protein